MNIIDNFLLPEDFNSIQNLMMGGEFPWYWNPFINYDTDVTNEYNGTAWTNVNTMITGRDQLGSSKSGTQSAALAMFGGPNYGQWSNSTQANGT